MINTMTQMFKVESESSIPQKPILSLLFGLIFIDLIIIGLGFYNSWIPDDQWKEFYALAADDSIGELVQYFKWFAVSVLFVIITIKRSSSSFIAWAILFLYLLLDDSLSIHENVGGYLVSNISFGLPGGLRMQDIGELIVSGIVGSILLVIFMFAYKKSNDFFKITTHNMFFLFLALVFFGVFFDVFAVMTYSGNATAAFLFDVIEDGGEMIVGSFMLWYAVLTLNAKNLAISLTDTIRSLFSYRANYKLV